MHEFMQTLTRQQQLTLAHGRLKKFHPQAVESLGEMILDEEKSLMANLETFGYGRWTLEDKINKRKNAGEIVKLAGKAKMRREILRRFKEAFGRDCIDVASVGLDSELNFKMRCCGWILSTYFEFNGSRNQMGYFHHLRSEWDGSFQAALLFL
jgi:hypothetical protein